MRRSDVEHDLKPTTTAAENAGPREAKRRIRLLEQENEVLHRAAAYRSQATRGGVTQVSTSSGDGQTRGGLGAPCRSGPRLTRGRPPHGLF